MRDAVVAALSGCDRVAGSAAPGTDRTTRLRVISGPPFLAEVIVHRRQDPLGQLVPFARPGQQHCSYQRGKFDEDFALARVVGDGALTELAE
jgi:hypothetical protein